MAEKINPVGLAESTADWAIINGFTATQLGKMFGKKPGTVTAKLKGISPTGIKQKTYLTYHIMDAAPALIDQESIDEQEMIKVIMKMNVADLPRGIAKDVYIALNSRADYLERMKKTWVQEDVQLAFIEIFKTLKESLLRISDELESHGLVTPEAREFVAGKVDGGLHAAEAKMVELCRIMDMETVKMDPEEIPVEFEL